MAQSNTGRLIALGTPPPLAEEITSQISASSGGGVTIDELNDRIIDPQIIGVDGIYVPAWAVSGATKTPSRLGVQGSSDSLTTAVDKVAAYGAAGVLRVANPTTDTHAVNLITLNNRLASTAPAALAATAAVGTGTTFARADHVHAIPGASNGFQRGTVLRAAAQVDSTATDVAGLVTDFNALLAKLRTAGVIAT